MKRVVFLGIFVVGLLLLYFGFQASDSVEAQVREAVGGNPSDQTIWFLVGGALLAIVGAGGLLVGGKKAS